MSELIKDFRLIDWRGRKVTIVFDSDILFNSQIREALSRLRQELVRLEASPYRKDLPHVHGRDKVGLDDFLAEHGKKAFLKLPSIPLFRDQTITGAALMEEDLPPMQWIVQKLLPAGLAMLAGPPKVGKSWMVLSMVYAVTSGTKAFGHYDTEVMDCLYIALEDPPRRLKKRLEWFTAGINPINERSHFATEWERVEDGGLIAIERALDKNPNCKIVFIDTFAKMRIAPTGRASLYHEDYEAMSALKRIADQRGICIVVVHHLRKAEADDFVDRISGSTGITGAADTIMVLVRGRNESDGTLYITGRDVEEQAIALKFEKGHWSYLGEATQVGISQAHAEILTVLNDATTPLGPKDIAALTGKKSGSLPKTLARMVRDGLIEWQEGGKYKPKTRAPNKYTKPENDKGNNK